MFSRQEIEQSIPARFAAQVGRAPEAIAISAPDGTLSYRELEDHSNRIAAALPPSAPPQPIALLMGQSALLPAAILGILKAGHFYVPFDRASTPLANMRRMIEDAGARVLVCGPAGLPAAAQLGIGHTLLVSAEEPAPASARNAVDLTPDSLAYVYYTSGSTGEPKGVVDSHRNVLHNIYRYTNGFRIGPADRLTLLQSAGFSGAVSSLFCALLNGATSYPLASRDASPASLARWVNGNGLTMWHSVPSLFRQLCASGERFPSVRVVRLEGDQAAPGDLALFRRYFGPDAVLANSLGATETGISRRYVVSAGAASPDDEHADIVPVGHAVEDMELVLLDASPEGIGEIGFKSRYLALGYWNRPDLTARAFTPCPDGRRLYRTGDLGRLRGGADCLELLGRKDHAIKIAGNRVEILEVEAALCRLVPGIRYAAAAARPNRRGDLRLCAWLVAEAPPGEPRPPAGEMRRRLLAAHLPPCSVPSVYSFIDALPLNANGKVDRAALPAPDRGRPHLETSFVTPLSGAEQRMAAAWCDVLELDQVGIDDDFFDLGGSSLDAARLAERLGIPIENLAGGPTIRELTEPLPPPSAAVTVRAGGSQPPLFCVPPHSGLLIGYWNLARHLAPGRPVICLRPPEIDDAFQPYSVKDLAFDYLDAVRAIQPRGPYYLAGHCFGGSVAYEMACLLEQAGQEVALLVLIECYYEGWIEAQPLARRASARLRHGAQRTIVHLQGGPSHWAALRRRVTELRLEANLQEEFERLVDAGGPLPSHLCDPRFANRLAAGAFAPEPYSGRVLLFESAHPRAGEYPAPLMGWGNLLRGEAGLCRLTGEFQSLLSEPVVAELARELDSSLKKATGVVDSALPQSFDRAKGPHNKQNA